MNMDIKLILILLKLVCLLVGVIYGFSNTVKATRGQGIGFIQIVLMALGIVGFVFIQFKLYL